MTKRTSSSRTAQGLPLSYRLILASMLPIVLLSIIVTVVSTYILRQFSLDLILEHNTPLAHALAVSVAENLNSYLGPLQSGASAVAQHVGNPAQQGKALRDLAPLLQPNWGDIALLDATGIAIATTPGDEQREGLDYSFRDYFQAVRASHRPAFSVVLKEKPSGRDAVVVATPVLHNGEFGGVLIDIRFLDDARWTASLGPLSTPEGGQVYLIDSEGMVIFHPQRERIGTNIKTDDPLWRLVSAGKAGSLLRESQFSDSALVTSYAPLTGIGWGLIVEEPWDATLAPMGGYRWAVGGLLGVGVLLSVIMLILGVNRVVRPLNVLVREAGQVSGEVHFHPLTIQGPPELCVLIRAFNHMVTRLAEQQAALRRYAVQVIRSQEDERKRLSRELHDDTAQQLVGLVQRLDLCRNVLEQDPAGARQRLDELQELAEGTLTDVRRMSNDLRPHILEDLGLAVALETLCEELSEEMPYTRIRCELVGSERRLPSEVELTVFRVVQEALTNVRKHASSATSVDVTLRFDEEDVTAGVTDNGPGFHVSEPNGLIREGHLGLAGMNERARLIGGVLSIVSTSGEGTTVTLRTPLEGPGSFGDSV